MSDLDASLALLYSPVEPTEAQKLRFTAFLKRRGMENAVIEWVKTDEYGAGFRLEAGDEVFSWSADSLFRSLTADWRKAAAGATKDNVIPLLRESTEHWVPTPAAEQYGSVKTVGDGIAVISGITGVMYGEVLLFENDVRGMALTVTGSDVSCCVLFGGEREVFAGSRVHRTGKTAGVPAGEAFLGRVVDALGSPIDGKGEIEASEYRAVEHPAPGIIDRQPVNRPLETGILAIDSMFPIGRGQRELIIGDRETGKTAIALDTIVNQKGKNVVCVYVAIGQKAGAVAQLTENLRRRGALDYTVIVCASAADSASLQYIAPYTGCTLAEYFMEQGRDVLIVYDDLSKHAVAYRTLSLLLGRSPGREAFPGDVFYLHSRLLERSAHLSKEKGGGSLTALPIVETQAGDVSAYIPTNIISITDGQLFLENGLFFSGQRPALNVGLSVSRVGGDAQTKAMKKACGTLRIDLAQYREIEVFTQFSSDLDAGTKQQLRYGQGLMRLLRQEQYHPYSMPEQVILLVAALDKVMVPVPVNEINRFSRDMLDYFAQTVPDIASELVSGEVLTDDLKQRIRQAAHAFADGYAGR